MLRKITLFLFVTVFIISIKGARKPTFKPYVSNNSYPQYKYPLLYRDQVYTALSDQGKEIFYATNIHPACVAKKGECIPRAKCKQPNMLYLSRVCYKRDLVCCYDITIKFPSVYVPWFSTSSSTGAPALRAGYEATSTTPGTTQTIEDANATQLV